jgi:hypothetical protein
MDTNTVSQPLWFKILRSVGWIAISVAIIAFVVGLISALPQMMLNSQRTDVPRQILLDVAINLQNGLIGDWPGMSARGL